MSSVFHKNKPIIKWKGDTFTQVSSSIKLNTREAPNVNNYFKAQPSKIYRRVIACEADNCNPRISIKIEEINRPGGSNRTSSANSGLDTTTDIIKQNNSSAYYENNDVRCLQAQNTEANALRRVRSAGMSKRNDTKYYSDSSQYLKSRNLSFKSNEFFSLKKGDADYRAGTSQAANNVYVSTSVNHCNKFKISEATSFKYVWYDDISYNVPIVAGEYDISDINNALYSVMSANNHYKLEIPHRSKEFFIKFLYDASTRKVNIELKQYLGDTNSSGVTVYSDENVAKPEWTDADTDNMVIRVIIDEPVFANAIGFNSGSNSLPSVYISVGSDQIFMGPNVAQLIPNYSQVYYKPSNHQFATQGAVSSSDLIARKKYDNITNVGASFRSAFGKQTMNAIAYYSSDYGFTIKDKLGYPTKKTPVFTKYESCCKENYKYKFV